MVLIVKVLELHGRKGTLPSFNRKSIGYFGDCALAIMGMLLWNRDRTFLWCDRASASVLGSCRSNSHSPIPVRCSAKLTRIP